MAKNYEEVLCSQYKISGRPVRFICSDDGVDALLGALGGNIRAALGVVVLDMERVVDGGRNHTFGSDISDFRLRQA